MKMSNLTTLKAAVGGKCRKEMKMDEDGKVGQDWKVGRASTYEVVDRPTQLIYICICQETNTKDTAGKSATYEVDVDWNLGGGRLVPLFIPYWWWNQVTGDETENKSNLKFENVFRPQNLKQDTFTFVVQLFWDNFFHSMRTHFGHCLYFNLQIQSQL